MKIQINDPVLGWVNAADIYFDANKEVTIEYDVEYASKHLGEKGCRALSINLPVSLDYPNYRGEFPGFMTDLIPQGKSLKKVLARYNIDSENSFEQILRQVPLASPGNLRIFEAWEEIEIERPSYKQSGFELKDLIERSDGFIDYMLESSAPIGGTTGAQGGAPKFLLRRDVKGMFHADGFLEDSLTDECFMIKFPIDAADNSVEINKTEKIFYDYLLKSQLTTHKIMNVYGGILFCRRFDRVRSTSDKLLHYHGLETVYSLMERNTFASSLYHEDIMMKLSLHSSSPAQDLIEYLCRDVINQAFKNSDNHGRNTSIIKYSDGTIRLSPVYDVAPMKLFKGDHITELTTWKSGNECLENRIEWLANLVNQKPDEIKRNIRWLIGFLGEVSVNIKKENLDKQFREKISESTNKQIQLLKEVL
ncbi:type II toxin-antitoxin system HipA family toxin [bacterium]|nr:type II toxin-antitoxin system HipA family toxin [bacterium]